MGFTVDIKGNASHLDKTLKGVEKSLSNLGSVATTGLKSLAGIGVAGGAALTAFIVSSSNAASNIESLTMQFETLLGGADAAGKRMEEIVKFAASTPFEIQELAATSKLLQKMGGTLLATGDGLRMVGDASAIVGKPLEEIGLHIGRVFAAMTSGTSAGESVGRLQELGLITGDVKRELEALAAAQKKGTVEVLTSEKALAKLKGILSANEGAMARLAATTQGKLSNMKDNLSKLQVAFGTGFNEGLKDALDATNTFLPQLENRFKDAGSFLGSAITESLSGDTQKFALIGETVGNVIVAGLQASVITGLDNLGPIVFDKLFNIVNGANKLTSGGVMDFSQFKEDIANATGLNKSQTNFREQFSSAMESTGANASIKAVNIEQQIAEGTKKGITAEMSDAVKKGILEAWAKQPQGAKFSN
jgi:hypothetical protein